MTREAGGSAREGRVTEEEDLVPELGVSPAPSLCIECEPARPTAVTERSLVFSSPRGGPRPR